MDDCIDALFDPGRTETYRYFYIAVNVRGAYFYCFTSLELRNSLCR